MKTIQERGGFEGWGNGENWQVLWRLKTLASEESQDFSQQDPGEKLQQSEVGQLWRLQSSPSARG